MSSRWALRMSLVAGVFSAYALWCLYDALIGYPRFNQRAAEHNRLVAAGCVDDWPVQAAEKGWNPHFREEDRRPDGSVVPKSSWDMGTQYVMLAGTLGVAAIALLRVLRARGRSLQAGEDGFLTVEGELVPYADITAIDLALWQRKSIARVSFHRQGRLCRTAIDDWIYTGGDAVLAEVQRRTGLSPETPPPDQAPDSPRSTAPAEPHGDADSHARTP